MLCSDINQLYMYNKVEFNELNLKQSTEISDYQQGATGQCLKDAMGVTRLEEGKGGA